MAARRRAAAPIRFRCLFCGSTLRRHARRDVWTCPRCRAVFRAERNARGCVRRIAIDTCGADPCCRDLTPCPRPRSR